MKTKTIEKPAVAAEPAPVAARDFKINETEIQVIKMDQIDVPPKGKQVRPFDPQDDEYLRKVEFARSNRKWFSPIILVKTEAGRYLLVDGRHRFEASKECGWDTVEARVFTGLDTGTAIEIGLIQNLRSKQMSKPEIAAAVGVILGQRKDLSVTDLAAEMNCTPNTVRNYLSLNNLCTEAQRLAGKGKIKAANAYALALLPEEVQVADDGAWIKQAQTAKTAKFVKAVQDFRNELRADPTPKTRAASKERAAAVSDAPRPLSQAKLEQVLEEVRTANEKIIGAINESYQDGMIDGILIALGRKPILPPTRVAGFQPKAASTRTE